MMIYIQKTILVKIKFPFIFFSIQTNFNDGSKDTYMKA